MKLDGNYSQIGKETLSALKKAEKSNNKIENNETSSIEKAAKSDANYSQDEKELINKLKDLIKDNKSVNNFQLANFEPSDNKLNFELKIKNDIGQIKAKADSFIDKLKIPGAEEKVNQLKEKSLSFAEHGVLGVAIAGTLGTAIDVVFPTMWIDIIPPVKNIKNANKAAKVVESLSEVSHVTKSSTLGEISTGGRILKEKSFPWPFNNKPKLNIEDAELAYKAMRESKTDVEAISRYLKIDNKTDLEVSSSKVEKIKNYLFNNSEFTPDEEIAMAWHRLRTGKANSADVMLIKHESLEISLREANLGMGYRKAHELANKDFNWDRELRELKKSGKIN